jgi:hypothetical protein
MDLRPGGAFRTQISEDGGNFMPHAGLVAAGFFYAIERRTAEALVIAIIVVPSLYASSTRRSRSTRLRHRRVV